MSSQHPRRPWRRDHAGRTGDTTTPAQQHRRRLTVGEVKQAGIENWIGRIIIVGAVIAAAVSFTQIMWAAQLIGIPRIPALGFPVIVDGIGTVLAGLTMSVHSRPLRQRLYVWTFFLAFIAISLFCNALHAVVYVSEHPLNLPPELAHMKWGIVFLLAAIPPCGAAVGMHAYAFTRRHGVTSDLAAGTDARTPAAGPRRARPAAQEPAHETAERSRPAREPAPAAVTAARPERAHTPTPRPAEAAPTATVPTLNHDGAQAPVHGPVNGRPDNVPAVQWDRFWGKREAHTAWEAYTEHREETGVEPRVADVRSRREIGKDRTTVSKWMPLLHARWEAEHAVHTVPVREGASAHGVNGDRETVHAPVHAEPAVHARPAEVDVREPSVNGAHPTEPANV